MEHFREEIEHYGVRWEKLGLTPVGARILTYLMLRPEGEATFDEMVGYFKVSKSAVSNALKLLSHTSIVGYRTKPGERKRYFYIDTDNWISLHNAMGRLIETRNIMDGIVELRKKHDQLAAELKSISEFLLMLENEYPHIFEKWKQARKARNPEDSGLKAES